MNNNYNNKRNNNYNNNNNNNSKWGPPRATCAPFFETFFLVKLGNSCLSTTKAKISSKGLYIQ